MFSGSVLSVISGDVINEIKSSFGLGLLSLTQVQHMHN